MTQPLWLSKVPFPVFLSDFHKTVETGMDPPLEMSARLFLLESWQWFSLSSYEGNFSNCGEKAENFRTSTGFEWFIYSRNGWINERNDMLTESYIELRICNQVKLWSSQLCTSQSEASTSPLRSFEFLEMFCSNAPFPGPKSCSNASS